MCGSSKTLATPRVLQAGVDSSGKNRQQHHHEDVKRIKGTVEQTSKSLNPCAQEFIPPYTHKLHHKFVQPMYEIEYHPPLPPDLPTTRLNPPVERQFNPPPITYNIYTAPHIQMNCILPVGPPPPPLPPPPALWSASEVPIMCTPVPIPVVTAHFPTANVTAQPSAAQLNIPASASSHQGFMAALQPYTRIQECQSRSLLLSSVPPELSDQQLQQGLLAWGPIRALDLHRKQEGAVTVDFYDLRHANKALSDIRKQHIMQQRMVFDRYNGKETVRQPSSSCWRLIGGTAIWAHYAAPRAENQGTLVIFKLDITISEENVLSIFQQYGTVKEVRRAPSNNQTRFVEFFDVRDAERARESLDGKLIGSGPVTIHFSRLSGQARIGSARTIHKFPPRHSHNIHLSWNRDEHSSSHNAAASCTSKGVFPSGIKKGRVRGGASGRAAAATVKYGRRESFHGITGDNSSQFDFDEDEAALNCEDARTTVMIKNIPNQYDQDMLLQMLDSHCMSWNQCNTDADEPHSSYDFVYLPIDFKNKCNLGYAFVNFTSAKATWKLYRDFHMRSWAVYNSRKICQVTYARLQGRSSLEDHFKKSKFECDTDKYLPKVFDPPRNGQVSTIATVVGEHWQSEISSSKQKQEGRCGENQGQDSDPIIPVNNSSCSWHRRTSNHPYQNRRMPGNTSWNGQISNHIHNKPKIATYYRPKGAAPAQISNETREGG